MEDAVCHCSGGCTCGPECRCTPENRCNPYCTCAHAAAGEGAEAYPASAPS